MTRKHRLTVTNPLKITDTTLRDAHQSLAATRMRTAHMEPVAAKMDQAGFFSVEVWGGATFDVCTRFLFEDPWERIRTLKRLMPKTPLQMLLRGQNLVGYRNYPDDVVEAFVQHSAELGIDLFRIFDAVNDERNISKSVEAVKKAGKHAQLCICYSVTEEGRLGGQVYNLEYFVQKALTFQEMGADSICIKDMAGLLAPYDAFELVQGLKRRLQVPVQLHTHYTSGLASMTVLKAAEAGVDVADACLAPLALRTAQPAVEPLVMALRGTARDTGLDLEHLLSLGDYFETLAPELRKHMDDSRLGVVDARVLTHQVPGGMVSNLVAQLKEAEAMDRLPEVLLELPQTRKELGYPPLVTPTSQIVGVQAVNNVLFGRWSVISTQVKDYVFGLYGRSPAPVDPVVVARALKGYEKGEEPVSGRAADYLDPELPKAQEATRGLARDMGDVLIYALYPVTGLKFLRVKYGQEAALKEAQKAPEAKTVEPSAAPASAGPGSRTFQVSVADKHFQVMVTPMPAGAANPGRVAEAKASGPSVASPSGVQRGAASAAPTSHASPAAATVAAGETAVRAPMPGIVVRYPVEAGQRVKEGETVVILEAMKMENPLPAPCSGVVKSLAHQPGAKVQRGEVLVVIG